MGTGIESGIASEKYQILRELGRGGMGIVYLAEDRQLRRQVALKVLYDYLNRDQEFVERFQEEARSVSCLHHPNIVCIHGLESSTGQLAIDMEYVEGTSLDQLPAAAPHLVAAIARDVLGGLAACHHIGVIHRDIKPSNILLNLRGQAKITDFGLATAYANRLEQTFQGTTSSGFYMGTPRYMPLQAWEGAPPEPCWDLYSFGVVLHELLSGRPAFKGDNPIAVMRKQLTEPLAPLRSLGDATSVEFSNLVEALLDSSRKQTGLTCAEAVELLKESPEYQALHTSDSVATVPMLPRPKRRLPRKGTRFAWKPAALGAAVSAALVLAAGYWAFQPDSTPPESAAPVEVAQVTLPLPIPSGGAAFYDAQSVGTDGKALWQVETDAGSRPTRILGISDLTIFLVDSIESPANGVMFVSGYWAGYGFNERQSMSYGRLRGILHWEPQIDQPVLTLEYERDVDHQRKPVTSVGYRRRDGFDRTGFFRELEGNDRLMTLLYRELLGRNLPWAVDIESRLPADPGSRMAVAEVNDVFAVDGVVSEATWLQGAFDESGRIGELSAVEGAAGATLMARWDSEAFYLLAHCPEDNLNFEVWVGPGIATLPSQSGRIFHRISTLGEVSARYFLAGVQRPWTAEWPSRLVSAEGETWVEIAIPNDSLKVEYTPVPGGRWRINARFTRAGDGSVAARWGAEEPSKLEHGALLEFRRADQ